MTNGHMTPQAPMNQMQYRGMSPQDGMRADFIMSIQIARGQGLKEIELPLSTIQMAMGPNFNEDSLIYDSIEVFVEGKMESELKKREKTIQQKLFPNG